MSFKIATQQRSANRVKRSTARTSSSTRLRPTGYQVQRTIGNAATSRLLTTHHIQRKLTVSTPGDAAEREADRVAGEVMRISEPASGSTVQSSPISIQRSCPKCEEELKRKAILDKDDEVVKAKFADTSGGSGATGELESYLNTSRGAGEPLPSSSRSYFEPRFGRDLRDVRLHTDSRASQAANSISAKAFTYGKDIVFGEGQYAPQTHRGQSLLAHELTHVVQQSENRDAVHRDPLDDLKNELEELAKQQLAGLTNAPGPSQSFKGEPKCGPNFCKPFASKTFAQNELLWAGPLILAGIAAKVNTRVVPLWFTYLNGGSAPIDVSADFGADFTASTTTAQATKFLVDELRKDIKANPAGLPTAPGTVVKDFTPRLAPALAKIDTPKGPQEMNFNKIADIAGNVAGGIGKDQTKFPIGAKPSPFNDSREAKIEASLTRGVDGSLTVAPAIKFKVKDTIDLCPGDCGAAAERVATIPLSRFEATGIAGDVPLIVEFDAPASEQAPFVIPGPPKKPISGKVTAPTLRVRSAPNDSSAIVGSYSRGTVIKVLCQTKGAIIDGNDVWFKTDKGFVSARHVTLSGAAIPPAC